MTSKWVITVWLTSITVATVLPVQGWSGGCQSAPCSGASQLPVQAPAPACLQCWHCPNQLISTSRKTPSAEMRPPFSWLDCWAKLEKGQTWKILVFIWSRAGLLFQQGIRPCKTLNCDCQWSISQIVTNCVSTHQVREIASDRGVCHPKLAALIDKVL